MLESEDYMEDIRAAYRRMINNESTREDRELVYLSWIKSAASNEWFLWYLLDTEKAPSEKDVEDFVKRMDQILENDI